jgi:hypothetical protein
MKQKIYVMGSLKNPDIVRVGNAIRELGYDAFEDWHGGGEGADDAWQNYEHLRGRTYKEALYDRYATHIFEFDKFHLDESIAGVLVLPAGKSGHIELGYLAGQGKPVYVLFDKEPKQPEERFECMYRFAESVFFDIDSLLEELRRAIY